MAAGVPRETETTQTDDMLEGVPQETRPRSALERGRAIRERAEALAGQTTRSAARVSDAAVERVKAGIEITAQRAAQARERAADALDTYATGVEQGEDFAARRAGLEQELAAAEQAYATERRDVGIAGGARRTSARLRGEAPPETPAYQRVQAARQAVADLEAEKSGQGGGFLGGLGRATPGARAATGSSLEKVKAGIAKTQAATQAATNQGRTPPSFDKFMAGLMQTPGGAALAAQKNAPKTANRRSSSRTKDKDIKKAGRGDRKIIISW